MKNQWDVVVIMKKMFLHSKIERFCFFHVSHLMRRFFSRPFRFVSQVKNGKTPSWQKRRQNLGQIAKGLTFLWIKSKLPTKLKKSVRS